MILMAIIIVIVIMRPGLFNASAMTFTSLVDAHQLMPQWDHLKCQLFGHLIDVVLFG